MGLDNIIVLVLIFGAIGALVVVNLRSRLKNKQANTNPESGE